MSLSVIQGGVTMYQAAGRRLVYHLHRNCAHLRRAKCVVETRQVDLWPGFVCERCRHRGGGRWPYW